VANHISVVALNSSRDSETQFLDGPGRLAYDVSGPQGGPLVLCAPGMGDLRQAFRFTAPALVAAGYRVAPLDQRGQGESSSGWAAYGSPATGEDMLALVRHLGAPAPIIGHSSSAAAAAEEPSLVSAIVLLGPFARQRELSTAADRFRCGHESSRDLEPGVLPHVVPSAQAC
jgi:pimeloyl-ACP methyl ester carboxylesterase